MDVVFFLNNDNGGVSRVHADVFVASPLSVYSQQCASWTGVFKPGQQRKHGKYDDLCTRNQDLFFACGTDLLGNLSPEFDKCLSHLYTYIVKHRGIENNKRELRLLSAHFHKFKVDVVFCHARYVGIAWRKHLHTTLGHADPAAEPLDPDDLRFLKETGHVDWHQLLP